MRPPAAAVIGHLVWARTGRVWAVWRVPETSYMWLSSRRKHAEHTRVRGMLAALPAESMILSVAARIDPGEVAEAMIGEVDLDAHSGWVDVVAATLDRLEAAELYRRRTYLCAQLPDGSGRWGRWWRAASAPLLAGFGLAAPPVPKAELARALRQADELEAKLRSVRVQKPTAGEIRWLYARAARRGLGAEPPLAGWAEPRLRVLPRDGDEAAVASPSLAPLLDGTFHEGGDSADDGRPWHRRYLRIATGEGVSYQSFAAVADAPEQFDFPGGLSEWLFVADQLPFPVDWVCRIKAVPNQVAARAAARHQRELAGQVSEYEHEPAGPPPSLGMAMDAIDDERAQLAAAPSEPELQTAMVYAVWADHLDELEQRVGLLQSIYRSAEYHLPRPTGGQRDLFEAMLPGASQPRVCGDYRQYMLPRDLAAGMPFAGVTLGDPGGMLLGASRDAGCARPVLLDPAAGPRQDRDGSVAAFGALGSGKSYLAKRLAASVLLRGGQMLFIDRTQAAEYVRFAEAMSEAGIHTQVATIGDTEGSLLLDPLRVFDGDSAHQIATGYLATVCGLDPTSLEAATLARAAKDVAARSGRLADVLDDLHQLDQGRGKHKEARQLALRLEAIADNRFGAPAWGDGHSIDTHADCTVIHLPNLAVPSRDVLLSEHLSRRLLPEQVCSLGLLYLVAALARQVAYEHPGRFAALCMDEAWALTSTLPGQQLLADVIRDGRKHNAAAWIFSQHPDDLPAGVRDLVSIRFLFGLSGVAARTGLEWLGVEATDDTVDLVELWASRRDATEEQPEIGEPSECLMRDASGRIGHIEVAQAETLTLHNAFESNPARLAASAAGTSQPGGPDALDSHSQEPAEALPAGTDAPPTTSTIEDVAELPASAEASGGSHGR